MATPAGSPSHLIVGHVTKPHGTRGEVFVWPLTDHPERVFAAENDLLLGDAEGELGGDPEVVTVERSRSFKRGLLLKFDELERREDVEDMSGRYLLVPLDALDPLEEGEVFYHQLLGSRVETPDGQTIGVVREVFDTKAGHLLDVEHESGKRHLLPFVEQMIRAVDRENGRIVVEPPPGLLDL